MSKRQIVLASNNTGKIAEVTEYLDPLGWAVLPQSNWSIPSAPEPHGTFLENALSKARFVAQRTKGPVLSDDSGLCVPALGGAPGVDSRLYAGSEATDEQNVQKLLNVLSGVQTREAYFYCVLVYLESATDPAPKVWDGRWWGSITRERQEGHGGFGYDPVFWVKDLQCVAANLTRSQKNQLSHRGQALRYMVRYWEKERA